MLLWAVGGRAHCVYSACMQTPFGIPAATALVAPSDPDSLSGLLELLDSLPGLLSENLAATGDPGSVDNQPAASQAALLAAVDTMRPNGGKVHMFVTSLPNAGVHRLVPRYRGGSGDTLNSTLAAKQEILAATGTEWKAAAIVAAEASVCVDFAFLTQVRLTLSTCPAPGHPAVPNGLLTPTPRFEYKERQTTPWRLASVSALARTPLCRRAAACLHVSWQGLVQRAVQHAPPLAPPLPFIC